MREILRCGMFAALFMVLGFSGCGRHDAESIHAHGHTHPPTRRSIYLAPGAADADLSKVSAEMADAARALLASLNDEQRKAATFDFKHDERFNWHFIPRERKGLPFKRMTEAQRPLAHALVKTALSPRGYLNVTQIIELETVLRELEGRDIRDPELYFISIFGTPDPTGTWGWRFEGHHLSTNFTVVDGRFVAGAPMFYGTNPARVPKGAKEGLRVLAEEEDLGRALIKALPDEQRKTATIADKAFDDIVSGVNRKADIAEPKGVTFAQLSPEHQAQLRGLVEYYAHRLRDEMAADELAEIERAGWDKVHFAWAGGTEPGQPHYYRLQGPTFLVEYDDTQNNANHIHTVWRDMRNDFGADLLKEHYEAHEHGDAKK